MYILPVFRTVFESNDNVLVCAPQGSGKVRYHDKKLSFWSKNAINTK